MRMKMVFWIAMITAQIPLQVRMLILLGAPMQTGMASTIVMVMNCTTSSEAFAMQYTDDTSDVVVQFNRIASNLSVQFLPDQIREGKDNALNAQLLMFAQADSAAVDMYVDGSAATDGGNTRTLIGDASVLGSRNGSLYFVGTMQAVIIYSSDQSANRTGIETNINTFYSIYP